MLERTSEYFAPELLNRLDSILVFNKLSKESILEVVSLRLKDVADRLRDRRITLDVNDGAKEWLAKKGYSDVYGARAIARVVRTKVGPVRADLLSVDDVIQVLFPLAQKMLSGTIRWVLLGDKRLAVLMFLARDGDVVVVRASADGEELIIKDNHPLDTAPSKLAVSEAVALDL